MIFIETSVFTREIRRLLPDEEYRRLQTALMFRPDAGALISGGGGLRKVRWNLPGMGKRGALRVIYYRDLPAFAVQENRSRRPHAGTSEISPGIGQGVVEMKEDLFAKLAASIKEAGEIKAGRHAPSRIYEIKPPEIRMVRERLEVSQGEFAVMIGVSTRTLQNWEQGRRQPEGPAKALLTIASRNPAAVLDALHGQRTGPTSQSKRFSTRAARVSTA